MVRVLPCRVVEQAADPDDEVLFREVEALGAVNLAALEELTTSRERKQFLDAQDADLREAMATLEAAIKTFQATKDRPTLVIVDRDRAHDAVRALHRRFVTGA